MADLRQLAYQRDQVLDQWLRVDAKGDDLHKRQQTQVYLMTGKGAEFMPTSLRKAQERLLEAIEEQYDAEQQG